MIVTDTSNIGHLIVAVNSLFLIWSSATALLYPVTGSYAYLLITITLGLLFLSSQLSELSLANSLFSSSVLSIPIVLVQIHASHIILGTLLLCSIAYFDMLTNDLEPTIDFAILY
jgi:heme/copper-type cytochrome/quinol oxidase subunit 3